MQHLLDAVSEVVNAHEVAVRARSQMAVTKGGGSHHDRKASSRASLYLSSCGALTLMLHVGGCEWADVAVAQRVVSAAPAGCGERGGQRA